MTAALGLAAATVLVCAVVGVAAYRTGYENGTQKVTAEWNAERAATAAAQAEEMMKARQREQALERLNEQLKAEHKARVDSLVREHRRVVAGLRQRPSESSSAGSVPSGAPVVTNTCWCNGARLSREAGEFLVGENAVASQLQSLLRECRASYAEVERKLNGGEQ